MGFKELYIETRCAAIKSKAPREWLNSSTTPLRILEYSIYTTLTTTIPPPNNSNSSVFRDTYGVTYNIQNVAFAMHTITPHTHTHSLPTNMIVTEEVRCSLQIKVVYAFVVMYIYMLCILYMYI